MIPMLTSGPQARSSLITPLTSQRKTGSTPCRMKGSEQVCEMRSYGSDGATTGICYDGFYQNRMDDKDAVWTHFSSDEIAWACKAEPRYATEQPAPYKPFLDNDWCRYCLWPWYQGWNGWRRPSKAESNKMYDMWYYWSCRPNELLWVGGTYARDPKCVPKD